MNNDKAEALRLDAADSLAKYRDEFHIPRHNNGEPVIYLCGNSLGLQPKRTHACVQDVLDQWRDHAVKAHFTGQYPWMPYHEFLTEHSAELLGAKTTEVVCMNTLTANLHFMMVSFYCPTQTRYKILIEENAFPSDYYAAESQVRYHGYDPDDALLVVARPTEGQTSKEAVLSCIDQHGEDIALVLLPGVQYLTGEVFDIAAITHKAHEKGCHVGFDLAHAAGNITLMLHDWDVDFACWCSYKYLNSGPGSVAGCFIHERHVERTEHPRFAGWWGHDKKTRFLMKNTFKPILTAEAWQLSNPPILSLAAVRGALSVFHDAGGMSALVTKTKQLVAYASRLIKQELDGRVCIVTPETARGSQLSLSIIQPGIQGKAIHQDLEQAGVVCDWREPNVIRFALAPLYNSFADAYFFVTALKKALDYAAK